MNVLRIIVAVSFLGVAASQDIKFKGGDKKFHEFLNQVYSKIQVSENRLKRVQPGVEKDIKDIINKVASYDSCFSFGFQLQFKGSAYEGAKILFPDEFDYGLLNSQLTDKIKLERDAKTPAGFGYAKEIQTTCLNKFADSKKRIDAQKVKDELLLQVNKAIKDLKKEKKLRRNVVADAKIAGPAVTFEFDSGYSESPRISINLTIGIDLTKWPEGADPNLPDEVKNAHAQLVPKIINPNTNIWQISFSQPERVIMKNIDSDCGVRKKVLQLAKYFKVKTKGSWFSLASYNLKTILFHLTKTMPGIRDWTEDKLVDRFKDMIRYLIKSLKDRSLKSYFISGYDLYSGKPDLASALGAVNEFVNLLATNPGVLIPKMVTREMSMDESDEE